MSNENKTQEQASESKTSALVLANYELVFFRRKLGQEKLLPEVAVLRNKFVSENLVVSLQKIDEMIANIRNANAIKLPNGQFQITPEGVIDYGDKADEVAKEFDNLLKAQSTLDITDLDLFYKMREVFKDLNQILDEEETYIYVSLMDKLNQVK